MDVQPETSAAALTVRPETERDAPFLLALYAGTREAELALTGWTGEQKAAFARMQFEAQARHYHAQYPRAAFDVIERAGEPVGRLYVDRRPETIHVLDITLAPAHRNRGWGGALLRGLQAEARAQGKAVSIYVEKFNPAYRLYRRLGFVRVQDAEVYDLLKWTPPPDADEY